VNAVKRLLPIAQVILVALVSFGFGSCEKKIPAWRKETYQTTQITRQPAEVPLPTGLWEKMQAVGASSGAASAPAEHGGAAAKPASGEHESSAGVKPKEEVRTEFSPVTMYMIEKNRGILGGKNLELKFPPGGGELDLSDFVQPLRGSFYVLFQFEPDLEDAARGVFFLSGTGARKIGAETVGVDCNKYLDISSAVANAAKGQGLLVNTTDRRHVSALAGTYFFAATSKDHKVHIASVILKDRNSRDLECKR
jgi:hypothetical protein